MLLELPTDGLADSIGRKRIYLISIVVHMLAVLLFLLSFDYLTVALAALMMGAGRALSSGSIDAWFVDEFKAASPDGNLQKALAKVNMFIPLGLGAGSLIGGLLPMTLGRFLNTELGVTIFAANLVIVLAADAAQMLMTERLIEEKASRLTAGGWKDGFRKMPVVISTSITYGVKNRTVLVLLLVMMAFGFGLSGLELLWQPRVREIMGGESQTWIYGLLAAAYFLVTAAGSALSTPVCRRARDDYVSVMAILLPIIGGIIFILSLQDQLLLFAAFYLLIYMFLGMVNSPYGALYNEQVPSEQRSTMLSFQSLVMQGGGLSGSVILGYVAGISGIPAAWMVASVIVAFSSLGFLYLRSVRRSRSTAPAMDGKGAGEPPLTS